MTNNKKTSDKLQKTKEKIKEVTTEKVEKPEAKTTDKTAGKNSDSKNNKANTKPSPSVSQQKKKSSGVMGTVLPFIGLIALAGGAYFITQPRTLESFSLTESTKVDKQKKAIKPVTKVTKRHPELVSGSNEDENSNSEPLVDNPPVNTTATKEITIQKEPVTKADDQTILAIVEPITETITTETPTIEMIEPTEIEPIKTEVAPPPTTQPTTSNILQDEINRLTEKNQQLEALLSVKNDEYNSAKTQLDFMALEEHIRNGDDFKSELDSILNNKNILANLYKALQPLRSNKELNFTIDESLDKQFQTALKSYLKRNQALTSTNQTDGKDKEVNLWDRTIGSVKSLVTIRKVGADTKGDDDQSIIARIEANIKAGNYAQSQTEISGLGDEAMPFFAELKIAINQRLTIEKALSEARAALPIIK